MNNVNIDIDTVKPVGLPEHFSLFFFAPYSIEKHLGKAYNTYMEMVPSDDDWVCFIDRDVLFLTPDYGHQIREIIIQNIEAGLITCLTNRIGCKIQLYQQIMSEDSNILTHRKLAQELQQNYRHTVENIQGPISGFLMVIRKKVWKDIRFNENKNLLGVDREFSRRLAGKGYSILLMRGVYVFHYYRLAEHGSAEHLIC